MGSRAELIADVASALNREDVISDGSAAKWVKKATARLNQQLRLNEMLSHVVRPLTTNSFSVPENFLSVKTIKINTYPQSGLVGGNRAPLAYCTPDDLAAQQARDAYFMPSHYTTFGKKFQIAPFRSGDTLQLDLWYYAELTPLVADADSNVILDKYPDLYEKAMLVYGHRHLMEYDQSNQYEGLVELEVARLNEKKDAEKYGDGPLVMKPRRKIGGRHS